MFKKKSSFRGATKGVGSMQTGSFSPESGVADSPTLPRPPPTAIPKKVEAPKPSTPASIVPPGTKRVLVVGKYVVMTADVDSCDAVIVQGNLDGNIKAKYIVIMKGGCMRGKVECEEADVAGSFEGMEMIAHHRLTLSATARVGGKTTYHRLSVHDGAILTGELLYKPSSRDAKPSASQSSAKPAAVPTEAPEVAVAIAPESEQGDSVDSSVVNLLGVPEVPAKKKSGSTQ